MNEKPTEDHGANVVDLDERRKAPTEAAVVQKMNERHAMVDMGDKMLVMTERDNPPEGQPHETFSTVPDLRIRYANKPEIERSGGKPITWATAWLKSPQRREYPGLTFLPGGQPTVNGSYNLWRGWPIAPVPGRCDLYLDHVRKIICSGDDDLYNYTLDWQADAIQNPADRPGVALVLMGARGTGKGTFVLPFEAIFGRYFQPITTIDQIFGRFNSHLANAQLVFLDEAFYARQKDMVGRMKAEITERLVTIEAKHRPAMTLPNHRRYIIASNEDVVVPAGAHERRFAVLPVASDRIQDHAYFGAIRDELTNGGTAALFRFLLDRDLTGTNLRAVPKTQALAEQIAHSFDPVESWWHNKLCSGDLAEDHEFGGQFGPQTGDLHRDYVRHCEMIGARHPLPSNVWGRKLRKMCQGIMRDKHASPPTLSFPALDTCRACFDSYNGQTLNYGDEP